MIFNKDFYDGIWGTVHRHDYCEGLANRLVQKYGKCKILDIGTGCGYLIKTLREKGCDAWGLEISDYALQNSCIPDYIRKGDIRNIPFAVDSFDVVYSQGVWGYFPEDDIQKAWKECNRIGKVQDHNIDYDDHIPEHQYLIKESKEWWKDKFYPKILVACPTHICKEYAFQTWIDNVKRFTYPNYDIFVVDNSPNGEIADKYGLQIPIVKCVPSNPSPRVWMLRITESMAIIQKHFLAGNYWKWFNVESDVIPPCDSIEQMLEYGGESDWISHAYPLRNGKDENDVQQGIGCSLLSRRLMEYFDYMTAGDNAPDGWLWSHVRPIRKFTTMEMWGYFKVEHLHGIGGEEYTRSILGNKV